VNSVPEMIEKVESLLHDVDRYVMFIKSTDDIKNRTQEVLIKIQANNPDVLILFSSKSAISICLQMKKALERQIRLDYIFEAKQEKDRLLIFIFRQAHMWFSNN